MTTHTPPVAAQETPEIETLTPGLWARNIRRRLAEGTLRQRVWNDTEDGKDIACLLGAARRDIKSTENVPCAALCMPKWLAGCITDWFDALPSTSVHEYANRFADVVDQWCTLSPRAWRRIQIRFSAFCVTQGLTYARTRQNPPKPYWAAVEQVCLATVALLEEQAAEVNGPGEAAHSSDAAYAARAAALAADAAYAARAADAAYAARAADAAYAAYAARAAALAADAAAYAARAAAYAARAAALAADAARAAALAADAAYAARAAARQKQFDTVMDLIANELTLVVRD